MNTATKVVFALAALFVVVEAAGVAYLGHEIAVRNFSDKEARTQELEDYKAAIADQTEKAINAEHRNAQLARDAIEKKADTATNIATKALSKPSSLTLAVKTPLPVRVVGSPAPEPTPTAMADTNPKHGGLIDLFR